MFVGPPPLPLPPWPEPAITGAYDDAAPVAPSLTCSSDRAPAGLLVSLAIHVVVLLALALLMVRAEAPRRPALRLAAAAEEPPLTETDELPPLEQAAAPTAVPLDAFVPEIVATPELEPPRPVLEVAVTDQFELASDGVLADLMRSPGQHGAGGAVRHAVPLARNDPRMPTIEAGLRFLAARQLGDGSWNSGAEGDRVQGNAAATATAGLAFLRAGPRRGQEQGARQLDGAASFVCGVVERCPAEGLSLAAGGQTLIQRKLGTASDSFLALMFLVDVHETMPNAARRLRVASAVKKILRRLEQTQQPDGTWSDGERAWAPALAHGLAARAIQQAIQHGFAVDARVLMRLCELAARDIDVGANAAGIDLYADAARLAVLSSRERLLRSAAITGEAPPAAVRGRVREARFGEAQARLEGRMHDSRYLDGFGSDGGEEYLSFMLVGDVLNANDAQEGRDWNQRMVARVAGKQNADGSWSGHHCITDPVFCTATALMAILGDRVPRSEMPD